MSIEISFNDIVRAKKLAKQSKSRFPDMSYSKLLDHAAHELFNARNYHELKKWRASTIEKHVVHKGGISECNYCGRSFCSDIKEDDKEHRELHDAFEEAVTSLHYLPEQHRDREIRKKAGYSALSNGADIHQRMVGALDVLRGWFDRSLCSAIRSGYWKKHPSFETYVSYMIDGLHELHFPQDIQKELEHRFGRVDGVIKKGESYWYPPRE